MRQLQSLELGGDPCTVMCTRLEVLGVTPGRTPRHWDYPPASTLTVPVPPLQ